MSKGFWQGKSVFLTGHTGFKGGWMSLWLERLGARVAGYALDPPTDPSLFRVAQVGKQMTSTIGDIRDGAALNRAMELAQPEVVFHFAAQPLVRASYQDPAATFEVNVMGTVNLLEAVRRTPSVRAVVIVTSDKCYENREWLWGYRENEPMGGSDPYSSSKGCAELVTASYRRSFFADGRVAIGSVRAGNVIGGGDWAADRLVPDLIRAFGAHEKIALRYPESIRPWQHVLEPLRGYLMLARKLATEGTPFADGWNFGPRDEDACTTLEVVRQACAVWGEGASWEVPGTPQPHEAKYLKLDCQRARTALGWQPALPLEKALGWTIGWYREALKGEHNMRHYTESQIGDYEAIVAMNHAGAVQ